MPELPRCPWEGRTGSGTFGFIFGHLSVVLCGLCMGGGGEGKGEVVSAGAKSGDQLIKLSHYCLFRSFVCVKTRPATTVLYSTLRAAPCHIQEISLVILYGNSAFASVTR